jgi:hypothetical protein
MKPIRIIGRTSRIITLAVAGLIGVPLLAGCASTVGSAGGAVGGRTKTVHAFILDETASFAGIWPKAVAKVVEDIRQMKPDDQLLVIGLDNKSWDADDVRVPLTSLPRSALMAAQKKAELIRTVSDLKIRPTSSGFLRGGKPIGKPWGTDSVGSVDFCGKLIGQSGERAVRLTLCTDLADEPGDTSRRKNPHPFPPTRFTALFLASRSGEEVERRVGKWIKVLKEFDITSGPDDFYLASQSDAVNLARR